MENGSVINISLLPNVLSDDEFNYHFRRFSEGNLDVLDILVQHNLKLVYWYIDKYINCENNDYDEIFSVGVEALIEAFYGFDLDKNIKFSTFAITCIRNKISKYFRSVNKHKKVVSLDDLITDNDNSDSFKDLLCDGSISIEEQFIEEDYQRYQRKIVYKMLEDLNDVDRKLIMLYFGFYGKLYVQKEIAKVLGISQVSVSRRLSAILKRIRIEMELCEKDDMKEKSLVKRVA